MPVNSMTPEHFVKHKEIWDFFFSLRDGFIHWKFLPNKIKIPQCTGFGWTSLSFSNSLTLFYFHSVFPALPGHNSVRCHLTIWRRLYECDLRVQTFWKRWRLITWDYEEVDGKLMESQQTQVWPPFCQEKIPVVWSWTNLFKSLFFLCWLCQLCPFKHSVLWDMDCFFLCLYSV